MITGLVLHKVLQALLLNVSAISVDCLRVHLLPAHIHCIQYIQSVTSLIHSPRAGTYTQSTSTAASTSYYYQFWLLTGMCMDTFTFQPLQPCTHFFFLLQRQQEIMQHAIETVHRVMRMALIRTASNTAMPMPFTEYGKNG